MLLHDYFNDGVQPIDPTFDPWLIYKQVSTQINIVSDGHSNTTPLPTATKNILNNSFNNVSNFVDYVKQKAMMGAMLGVKRSILLVKQYILEFKRFKS